MRAFDARMVGVKIVVVIGTHKVTPITARMTPAIGKNGITGQRMMRNKLKTPPRIMRIRPTSNRIRREKKPTQRETSRSINIWNLRSREESDWAEAAEIWRKGLKRVRRSEPMEKKSMMLMRWE